ncbi:MAG: cation transporter [Candidatus Methanoplasma sp.]|jgi:copper chaperone CopZ|nr:cation transporter [Candidatus Methanoplasma sp.]
MRYTYRLDNLCCASCAANIEIAVNKIDGVESAKVAFMTTRLTLEADESRIDSIEPKISKCIRKIEPHIKMRRA